MDTTPMELVSFVTTKICYPVTCKMDVTASPPVHDSTIHESRFNDFVSDCKCFCIISGIPIRTTRSRNNEYDPDL
jgi:hypothetical protein